ncbi:hypothetical protein EJ04DRAFT_542625 [Polyplosphaeria fusca]|uniref:Heterokaryon incompatibility domain-containing protein n=1 Tax=Polyplosphaeria fusca TaxID=682080 RepID=A0A9P4V1E6_9PLEO|nr:hypothetical protein EJ04DRAFT_542625 [Polyplosphaeria fusca]
MRFLQLQNDGTFSLVTRTGSDIPPYAVLSHTWGSSNDEVLLQDIVSGTGKDNTKAGYHKLRFCGQQAREDYCDSAQCYVYLTDVSTEKREADYDISSRTWEQAFRASRWFSRGWTLQELISPRRVKFYSKEGQYLGDKSSLEQIIHEITRIPILALQNAPLREFSIKERMTWIGNRRTTLEEDKAYSLLGIFDVSMGAIYGEGTDKAFKRLQKEIKETWGETFSPLT